MEMQMPAPLRRASLFALVAVTVSAVIGAMACAGEPPAGRVIRVSADTIEFAATLSAASFDRRWGMPGYHAVVWRGGGAAMASLFRAEVTDVQVLDALESLG